MNDRVSTRPAAVRPHPPESRRRELYRAEKKYRALVEQRGDPADVAALGSLLIELDRYPEALSLYRDWTEKCPDAAILWSGLGDVLAAYGEREQACRALRRAVELDSGAGGAWYALTMLGDYEWLQRRHESLLAPDDPGRELPERYSRAFAAGRYLEHLERWDEAFEQFRRANGLRRGAASLEIRKRIEAARLVMRDWDAQDWTGASPGHPSRRPIFILGMPRSGTSLVEQILDSHPEVRGMGEKLYLQEVIGATLRSSRAPVARLDWAAAAGRYLDTAEASVRDAMHFTDKMVFNFNLVGFIRCMFPNAKIVHCRRDALDTCVSCFRTSFKQLTLSYDLQELGWFYGYYESLMEFWRRRCGDAVIEVHYEDLVRDPEHRIAGLLEDLGLPWSDRCTRFYANPRAVKTASMQQVRRKPYLTSVGRSKPYRKHLEPLVAAIEQAREWMDPRGPGPA